MIKYLCINWRIKTLFISYKVKCSNDKCRIMVVCKLCTQLRQYQQEKHTTTPPIWLKSWIKPRACLLWSESGNQFVNVDQSVEKLLCNMEPLHSWLLLITVIIISPLHQAKLCQQNAEYTSKIPFENTTPLHNLKQVVLSINRLAKTFCLIRGRITFSLQTNCFRVCLGPRPHSAKSLGAVALVQTLVRFLRWSWNT